MQTVTKRDWRNINDLAFKRDLVRVNWLRMKSLSNIDHMAEFFTKAVNRTLDKHALMKTWWPRAKLKNWVSADTKTIMEARDQDRTHACRGLSTA